MERVYYRQNKCGEYVKVKELISKKAHAIDDRKNLKPFGDKDGQFSTEVGENVTFEWVYDEEYMDDYRPKKKEVAPPIVSLDDYGPTEEQLLKEIREENRRNEEKEKASRPTYKQHKPVIYDKKTVIILNTDNRVCEYDIYELCKGYGSIKYIYNTNSKYNNIVFVSFYDEESGIECCNGVKGTIYNRDTLETQFMIQ